MNSRQRPGAHENCKWWVMQEQDQQQLTRVADIQKKGKHCIPSKFNDIAITCQYTVEYTLLPREVFFFFLLVTIIDTMVTPPQLGKQRRLVRQVTIPALLDIWSRSACMADNFMKLYWFSLCQKSNVPANGDPVMVWSVFCCISQGTQVKMKSLLLGMA